ncbi:tripartite-type tricarboxylate transporter receptor subunit TctC [Rhizobium sp. BK313]|uniref:Bug family tripartite tricarboxylate transporter substrate binding protein n=1 Tax=Rhizobium sp. BK313 TaxID=2587081 RepID=UPI00105C656F|nr:tripartite tricarboxylate transporter substrate binding protein [Rhizobium sp. BK313]MBB3459391.1 tripartite-type tricarboxylate transporter receptor subunit TctC [Rhizobium sp. BK313]
MPTRRKILKGAAALGLASFAGRSFAAAQWPSQPISFVVPFSPGGTGDIIGRLIAQRLTSVLGQSILIENRAGAGGTVGAQDVAKSDPDGYTFLMAAIGTLAFDPALYPKSGYDPVTSFTPVIQTSTVPNVLVVNPSVPAKTVAELVAYAKANPGVLNFSSAGSGSSAHVSMSYFNIVAGLDMVHIPYKGTGAAVTDCVANRVQLVMTGAPPLLPFIKSGQLRAIAVSSLERASFLPDLPTIAESGYPGFEADQWEALMAPAKTPSAIIDRVYSEITKLQNDPGFVTDLANVGAIPVKKSPAELAKFIASEKQLWGDFIRKMQIQPD